ncbi:DUF2301 domain-containing membrane protein [Photobacterium toruni]|uniref:DUF2301 domain-containing membrane protein n=1 Tax=Photobacterium toruni TaxID=1935446 RepID=A0A1T4R9D0_9GAMM|nr:DUF2301 domain-containing membrane protein [Photobacterium toruni]MEC6813578.1 DUF2301 domain-containing membrane protein [Photobacterium toruni]MEC6830609.1 DUF2301 domain-containing membrane protein [Photobacterium toruni]SKA12539.1 hypothetical protein CZ814_01238 [Photobacterium toruni]
MADPHIKCELDILDKLTVILYRTAFTLAAIIMMVIGTEPHAATPFLIVVALLASTTVHIYDKRFRWLIQGAGLFAAIWFIAGLWQPLALGAALFVFSALSIKEYFCFQVKILLLTPLALAGFWFCLIFNVMNIAIGLAMVGAALLAFAAFSKWRMPLHFDIGDKSRYQV